MLRLILVGTLIALAFSGVPAVAAGGASDALAPSQDSTRPPWFYRLADVRLELESHSPMSGRGRVHLITIRGDGTGECGLAESDEEPHGFRVTEGEVVGLLDQAYSAYFFDMPSVYHGSLHVRVEEDGSAYVIGTAEGGGDWRALTVTIGEYSKRVEAKDGYPEQLRELIRAVQEFALRCLDDE